MQSLRPRALAEFRPVNEKLYHQCLGDWKGSFSNNHQAIEFKVVSISGSTAQIEYTHNGRTERGTATVDQNFITFGNVTIATRDGKKAALEFSFGTREDRTLFSTRPPLLRPTPTRWRAVAPARTASHSVSFQVTSINGRDAQVKYTVDGNSGQGVGDVYEFRPPRQRTVHLHRRNERQGDVPVRQENDLASRQKIRTPKTA